MNKEAASAPGSGIAWLGFWLMIGLANFGEDPCSRDVVDQVKQVVTLETRQEEQIQEDQ